MATAFKMEKISVEDLLAQYARGQRDFEQVDLSCADLFEANLQEINLKNSKLVQIYLPYGDLSQANLEYHSTPGNSTQ
uniref:Pentapeptide repeat-containing protein n=1 Tax=Desertifilum tharense IPPAS B-1220 TaxID=1781255 RepID=A0ACD5GTJ1_9CYAN